MDSCAIQSMDIKPFVQAVKRLAESTGTTVYDEVKHCGSLRQLMLRRSIIKGDIMAVLVVNEELKQPEMWAKGLLEAGACSVWKDINTEKGNIVLSPKCEFMAGRKDFEDDIAGVHFNLSPLSFLQVNHLQAVGALRNYNPLRRAAGRFRAGGRLLRHRHTYADNGKVLRPCGGGGDSAGCRGGCPEKCA